MRITGKHGMASLGGFLAAAALVVVGAQAMAEAPAATPPASKPLSTSLDMIVFPAKGQTAQQHLRTRASVTAAAVVAS